MGMQPICTYAALDDFPVANKQQSQVQSCSCWGLLNCPCPRGKRIQRKTECGKDSILPYTCLKDSILPYTCLWDSLSLSCPLHIFHCRSRSHDSQGLRSPLLVRTLDLNDDCLSMSSSPVNFALPPSQSLRALQHKFPSCILSIFLVLISFCECSV